MMAGEQHLFKVVVQPDYTCKIELGGYEEISLLDQLAKCLAIHNQMGVWMDSKDVSVEQKEQYQPMFLELLHSISFLWDLLLRAGVTKDKIREHMEIPF